MKYMNSEAEYKEIKPPSHNHQKPVPIESLIKQRLNLRGGSNSLNSASIKLNNLSLKYHKFAKIYI